MARPRLVRLGLAVAGIAPASLVARVEGGLPVGPGQEGVLAPDPGDRADLEPLADGDADGFAVWEAELVLRDEAADGISLRDLGVEAGVGEEEPARGAEEPARGPNDPSRGRRTPHAGADPPRR